MNWESRAGTIVESASRTGSSAVEFIQDEQRGQDRLSFPVHVQEEVVTVWVHLVLGPAADAEPVWEQILKSAHDAGAFSFLEDSDEDVWDSHP